MRRRHWGLVLSVFLLIVAPLAATILYLVVFAQDQYASTTGFTIRQEETGSASEFLGGLSQFVGSGTAGNADVLFEFIQSQEIVERVNARFDLIEHYSATWPQDPAFSIWPGATIEDLLWFWKRMVRITYDKGSGLIMAQVRARDPQSAQTIARLIVSESEEMINMLNDGARRDTMRNAESDLAAAVERLRAAREAMAEFRARTQIVDPLADIQGRMGVLNNLQQQLAQALVDHDLLLQVTETNDPRLRQAQRRIEVIQDRIAEERSNFSSQDVTVDDTDYPRLLAQYESLRVDQEFAEQTYRAALTAFDAARSNSARQSLYLAAYIRPTLAQRAEYPQRIMLIGLTALFLSMIWGILALVYYSLRDRG
ncbi:MAG: sugar transporter [Pararhodobacter sp.]